MESDPVLVDVAPAKKRIPGFRGRRLLHAGPPIKWERTSGPLRGAILGAILYEGWADDARAASRLAASEDVEFDCTHHHNAVGPMAGVISPNMPVFELEDRKFHTRTYSNMNEGTGKVLRFGAYDGVVLRRLKWIAEVFAPVLAESIKEMKKDSGALEVKRLAAQALTMGDDCHSRHAATAALFIKANAPYLVRTGYDAKTLSDVIKFINQNNFTTLNLVMAAAKAMTLAAHGLETSTIVTVMARNGTDVGIWVSSLGREWFTAPAPVPQGLWFPGFSSSDANPDIGDSAITETAGFGAFAMAAAPALTSWVGGTVKDGIEITNRMYKIAYAKHKYLRIPSLGFKGTPVGIDLRRVVAKRIAPVLNTGIAHRNPGVGQIGNGVVSLPLKVFKDAFKAYTKKYQI